MNAPFFKKLLLLSTAVAVITGLGFQCSSPNIQAGKLYFQQYQSGKDEAKLDDAIRMFRKEITENPNSSEGWYWLGISEGMKRNFTELRTSWIKAKQLGPGQEENITKNTPYMWLQAINQGSVLFQKARAVPVKSKKDTFLKEAEEAYVTANYLWPDTSAKYNGFAYLANVHLEQERVEDAIKALESQIALSPTSSAYSILGRAYILQGDKLKKASNMDDANRKYDQAITSLNNGIRHLDKDPAISDSMRMILSAELNQILMNAYIAADRLSEAESMFKRNADDRLDDAIPQFNYGTILLNKDDYEGAVVYLERAVTINPSYEQALQNLAAAYLKWGFKMRDKNASDDISESSQEYKNIIRKAVPHIETLLDIRKNDASIYDLAAKVYASIGDNEKANEMFKKADELRSAEK